MDELEQRLRAERAGRNQSLFRAVNEQIESLAGATAARLGSSEEEYSWVCECAETACAARIAMTIAEYEAVRADDSHFVVAPSEQHFEPAAERILERRPGYWVVEKFGRAEAVARAEAGEHRRLEDAATPEKG